MIKIGCVNIDTSHPNTFVTKMKETGMDMKYSAVYNDGFRSDEEVNAFMEKGEVEKRYESLEEMVEVVDIGFVHDCNWDKHLDHAMPFINAGKPVFIDKPIVGNLKDCLELKVLAEKGAKILGSSSLRYCQEVEQLKTAVKENDEKIATVFGTAGNDEFNYGVHIMEGIHGLLGPGVYSTTYLGTSKTGQVPAEQYLVKWNNGTQVIYQIQMGKGQPFHIVVTTDKAIHHAKVNTGELYVALLSQIQAYMKEDKPMASMDDLIETIKIYLAGRTSRQLQGREIALRDLRMDDPGYDGYVFEKVYSKR